jgi:transposase-like protein
MKAFKPPFCASPSCSAHIPDSHNPYSDYIQWGRYRTRAFGFVPRFRCTRCGKTFSAQTFRVDYYAKKILDYEDLTQRLVSCESLSAIGRAMKASTNTVANRISRASRQVLAFESRLAGSRKPREDLAADGFESFCVSQFFPNNIHLLVGSESQFVYVADHVSLRRKGSMTEGQKRRRAELDSLFRPPPGAIATSFARIATESLAVLSDGGRPALTLWTDEKREYPRGIGASPCASALQKLGRLEHRTVSSRAARTRTNPLFPVNYLDREIRKDLHEHTRETVCFGRNVNRQMERLVLYLYWHNFRKRHRARGDPKSHAEVAGYDKVLAEKEGRFIWERRAWHSLTDLSLSSEESWLRGRRTPHGKERDYLPAFALS